MADKNLQQQAQMRENLMARWIAKHPENILLMQKDRSGALKEFQHWAMLGENNDKVLNRSSQNIVWIQLGHVCLLSEYIVQCISNFL